MQALEGRKGLARDRDLAQSLSPFQGLRWWCARIPGARPGTGPHPRCARLPGCPLARPKRGPPAWLITAAPPGLRPALRRLHHEPIRDGSRTLLSEKLAERANVAVGAHGGG